MGTSSRLLLSSTTSMTRSAQSQPVQSPFPFNQVPGIVSAQIVTPEGRLAAVAALMRYSHNQGYFIYQHVDPNLATKAITIKPQLSVIDGKLKIALIEDTLPDLRCQRVYIQVHHNAPQRLLVEHLLDHLAEGVLGNNNLELKKNVTIDVFDSDSDAHLRDNAGFIVTDRLQLHQISVDTDELLKALQPAKGVSITSFNVSKESDLNDVFEYDQTLSSHNRNEFLQYLFTQTNVYVAKSANEEGIQTVVGYIVASKADSHVMALYADNQSIANTLLLHHLKQSKPKRAILCAPRAQWRKLSTLISLKSRAVYRRHTRAVPSNIKWERIFAFNAGLNLF